MMHGQRKIKLFVLFTHYAVTEIIFIIVPHLTTTTPLKCCVVVT
jgi:hypothetical protein